jgi:hypothetical protein
MKKIIALSIVFVALISGLVAQANLVSPGSKFNTTDPPNLSWVVGEFEVIKRDKGEAILAPIKQPLLPRTITVNYQRALLEQYPWFEPTQKLTLVIRDGWISQVFTN